MTKIDEYKRKIQRAIGGVEAAVHNARVALRSGGPLSEESSALVSAAVEAARYMAIADAEHLAQTQTIAKLTAEREAIAAMFERRADSYSDRAKVMRTNMESCPGSYGGVDAAQPIVSELEEQAARAVEDAAEVRKLYQTIYPDREPFRRGDDVDGAKTLDAPSADRGLAIRLVSAFWVTINWSGAVFVKTDEYFRSQDGLTEDWGRHWRRVHATSLEHAREVGCALKGANPYQKQASYEGYLPSQALSEREKASCGIDDVQPTAARAEAKG